MSEAENEIQTAADVQPTIARREVTNRILKAFHLRADKNLGQNFLVEESVVARIAAAAELTPDDRVLEIGPGIGTLTQALARTGAQVTSVELDQRLLPVLKETVGCYANVRIVHGDILKTDIPALMGEGPFKVAANLPYYITTPIIMELFESHVPIESITIMVQKEVAERMQTGPGSKEYGALSLAVQYYAQPEIIEEVPPDCFMPRPKVGSAVVRLVRYENPPVQVNDEKLMFSLIRAAFNQRRKTLANGIKNAGFLDFTREEVVQALETMGLPADIRGEKLDLEKFGALSNALEEIRSRR